MRHYGVHRCLDFEIALYYAPDDDLGQSKSGTAVPVSRRYVYAKLATLRTHGRGGAGTLGRAGEKGRWDTNQKRTETKSNLSETVMKSWSRADLNAGGGGGGLRGAGARKAARGAGSGGKRLQHHILPHTLHYQPT